MATNEPVCTISVIHNQIKDEEKVILVLCEELGLSEEYVRKRVEKVSSIERIKSNVPKEVGKRILSYELAGVKVDEDYKRIYPYNELASKVLGFTGRRAAQAAHPQQPPHADGEDLPHHQLHRRDLPFPEALLHAGSHQ